MKIERALGMLFLLLNRRNIKASELAEYFEVSQRTVYRDIELLAGAGVPIYCEQGRNGGISIVEGWSVAGGSFDNSDIEIIKTALSGFVNSFGDNKSIKTLEKIGKMAEISSEEKREKVYIDLTMWGDDRPNDGFRKIIQESIENRNVIEFIYRNQKNEEKLRVVEPMVLVLKGFSWYLHGLCRDKGEKRLFKISRMRELKKRDEVYTTKHINFEPEAPKKEECVEVELRFSEEYRYKIEEYKRKEAVVVEEDGSCIMKTICPNDNGLIAFILSFGDDVEVVSPLWLREKTAEKIEKALKKYR